ncbi:MAG: glycosyltransferase family 4 protein [Acidimicrobiia bacterium]|nr:glycosyltransferase family 4 protein [Acidimicrobiia bacterium]
MAAPVRPRLLVVAPSAELYGSDRALLAALPGLLETFDVVLAVPACGPASARAAAFGAEVVILPDYALRRRHLAPRGLLPWLARSARAALTLHRLHRRRPFDVVYSNTLAAALGSVLAPAWRVPHVLHVHECPTEPRWLAGVLLAVARVTTDRIVANSAYTRSFLVGRQPALSERTTVVHNGIDLPEPLPPPPASTSLRITLVGRVHPKKGHAVLLDAAARARQEGGDWQLDLFGDTLPEHEGLREDLVRQAEASGLSDRVTWHGFVDDPGRTYGAADVAVVPSVVPEEFSLVCLEAQAMCLPVVATGPGGPSEVLADGETGVVVPPNDSAALARALLDLERDPVRRSAMGRRGREHVLARFSRQVYAAGVRSVCEEAIASGAARRGR